MESRPRAITAGKILLCLAGGVVPLLAQVPTTPTWEMNSSSYRQAWLREANQRLKRDSDRLAELAHSLRQEADQHDPVPLAPAVLERVEALEKQSVELRDTVAKLDENILSLQVIADAKEIKKEARALEGLFADHPAAKKLKECRRLSRDIAKQADAIAAGMTLP